MGLGTVCKIWNKRKGIKRLNVIGHTYFNFHLCWLLNPSNSLLQTNYLEKMFWRHSRHDVDEPNNYKPRDGAIGISTFQVAIPIQPSLMVSHKVMSRGRGLSIKHI